MDDQIKTQADIDVGRKAADIWLKQEGFTNDEYDFLRRKAKNDLFFLARGVLRYNRLSPDLHGNLCHWIQDNTEARFKIILMPRSHFKTTVSTISDNIRTVLPLLGGEKYPYDLGAEIRIMLAHETQLKSSQFVYEITEHFTSNPRLMGLFPELVPNAHSQRINKTQLELPRSSSWSEPTFEAFGVGGKSQGRHYDKLDLDDIFGEAARDSLAERDATIQWFKGIHAFFVMLKYSHLRLVGTRYSLDDVYAYAMEAYGPKLLQYIRKVIENGKYIFHEEIDDEAVEIIKKDPKVWNAWYLNDPMEGMTEFNIDWLKWYNTIGTDKIGVMTGESAERINIYESLDRIIIFDPAVSGNFGIVVTGTDKNRIFVLDAIRSRMSVPDQISLIFSLVLKWKPRLVAIEEVNFSALYAHWLKREMQLRNLRFNIVPVKPRKPARDGKDGTGRLSKLERIKVLGPYFSAGRFYFNQNQHTLIDEYRTYGATTDIHMLDALAYGPELWSFHDRKQMERYQEVERQLLANRDPDTGYSRLYG
jgi:hypothetical protein